MKLSIILQGRNDNYCGNFIERLQLSINQHIRNIVKSNTLNKVEIIVSDWGSEIPLSTKLEIDPNYSDLVRFIFTPLSICKKYEKDSPYSMPHAVNVAIRRAKSEYIFFTDSDGFLPFETFQFILSLIDNNYNKILFCERRDIPKLVYENKTVEEIEKVISLYNFQMSPLFNEDNITFRGTAIGYFGKKEIFFELRGFDENMIYWGYFDLDFFKRVKSYFNFDILSNYNKKMYHLEHFSNLSARIENNSRKFNSPVEPNCITRNNEYWGLANEIIYESKVIKKGVPPKELITPYKEFYESLSLYNNNEDDRVINILRKLVIDYPTYYEAILLLAKTLIRKKEYRTAKSLLKIVYDNDKTLIEAEELLDSLD
ncbi:MAG TPA: glycosyltransferase [Ignavibacteriales bacterium]|nr:glycosyltransferase [Ignavibacteriales bacterium]HOL81178.1 glycosyltransferase [Ignavibacteriales bacterium]HPP33466.1 glycosyltransferase [Ignavibacteriales bacterium]